MKCSWKAWKATSIGWFREVLWNWMLNDVDSFYGECESTAQLSKT